MSHAKVLFDVVVYCTGAIATYAWFTNVLAEGLEEEELMHGHFTDPRERAIYEFIMLVLGLVWFVVVPLIIYRRLQRRRKR